jgi:hypothetical protein
MGVYVTSGLKVSTIAEDLPETLPDARRWELSDKFGGEADEGYAWLDTGRSGSGSSDRGCGSRRIGAGRWFTG